MVQSIAEHTEPLIDEAGAHATPNRTPGLSRSLFRNVVFALPSALGAGVLQPLTQNAVTLIYSPIIQTATIARASLVAGMLATFVLLLLGNYADQLRTPWGRRRPLVMIGALGYATCSFLLYNPVVPCIPTDIDAASVQPAFTQKDVGRNVSIAGEIVVDGSNLRRDCTWDLTPWGLGVAMHHNCSGIIESVDEKLNGTVRLKNFKGTNVDDEIGNPAGKPLRLVAAAENWVGAYFTMLSVLSELMNDLMTVALTAWTVELTTEPSERAKLYACVVGMAYIMSSVSPTLVLAFSLTPQGLFSTLGKWSPPALVASALLVCLAEGEPQWAKQRQEQQDSEQEGDIGNNRMALLPTIRCCLLNRPWLRFVGVVIALDVFVLGFSDFAPLFYYLFGITDPDRLLQTMSIISVANLYPSIVGALSVAWLLRCIKRAVLLRIAFTVLLCLAAGLLGRYFLAPVNKDLASVYAIFGGNAMFSGMLTAMVTAIGAYCIDYAELHTGRWQEATYAALATVPGKFVLHRARLSADHHTRDVRPASPDGKGLISCARICRHGDATLDRSCPGLLGTGGASSGLQLSTDATEARGGAAAARAAAPRAVGICARPADWPHCTADGDLARRNAAGNGRLSRQLDNDVCLHSRVAQPQKPRHYCWVLRNACGRKSALFFGSGPAYLRKWLAVVWAHQICAFCRGLFVVRRT